MIGANGVKWIEFSIVYANLLEYRRHFLYLEAKSILGKFYPS